MRGCVQMAVRGGPVGSGTQHRMSRKCCADKPFGQIFRRPERACPPSKAPAMTVRTRLVRTPPGAWAPQFCGWSCVWLSRHERFEHVQTWARKPDESVQAAQPMNRVEPRRACATLRKSVVAAGEGERVQNKCAAADGRKAPWATSSISSAAWKPWI